MSKDTNFTVRNETIRRTMSGTEGQTAITQLIQDMDASGRFSNEDRVDLASASQAYLQDKEGAHDTIAAVLGEAEASPEIESTSAKPEGKA